MSSDQAHAAARMFRDLLGEELRVTSYASNVSDLSQDQWAEAMEELLGSHQRATEFQAAFMAKPASELRKAQALQDNELVLKTYGIEGDETAFDVVSRMHRALEEVVSLPGLKKRLLQMLHARSDKARLWLRHNDSHIIAVNVAIHVIEALTRELEPSDVRT